MKDPGVGRDSLRRHSGGRPTFVATLTRAWRWHQHNRLAAGLIGIPWLALTIGLTAVTRLYLEQNRRRELAEATLADSRAAMDTLVASLVEPELRDDPELRLRQKELLEPAREFYQMVIASRKDEPTAWTDLASAHRGLARIAAALGPTREEVTHNERARTFLAKLVAAHPKSLAFRSDLGGCQRDLGRRYAASGRNADAEAAYERGLAIWRRLADEQPQVALYWFDLAGTIRDLGFLYAKTGRVGESEASLRRALEIAERLTAEHPESTAYLVELAHDHTDLASVYKTTGRATAAAAELARAIAVQNRLVANQPRAAPFQRALAASLESLANLDADGNDPSAAEASYRKSLEVRERLVADHPQVVSDRVCLAASSTHFARLLARTGRGKAAEALLRRALELRERLATDYREQTEYAVDLGGGLGNLGDLKRDMDELEAAEAFYARAVKILDRVYRRVPRHESARDLLRKVSVSRAVLLGRLGRHVDALEDWERALEVADGARDQLRLGRALALVRSGAYRSAVAEAEDLAATRSPSIPPGVLAYDLARLFALASGAAGDDPRLAPAVRTEHAAGLAKDALNQLSQAEAAGAFHDPAVVAQIDADADLMPLAGKPAFQAWLTALLDRGFPADAFARGRGTP